MWRGVDGERVVGHPVEAEVAEALAVATALDDPKCLLLATRARAESLLMQERPVEAAPALAQALELAEAVKDRSNQRIVLNLMAKSAVAAGDVDRARVHLTAAMDLVSDGTNPRALAWLLIQRGRIALADHDPPAAIADARQAAELHERLHDRRGLLNASVVLAEGHLRDGRPAAAAAVLTERTALLASADERNLTAAHAILDELGPDRADEIRRRLEAPQAELRGPARP